MTGTLRIVSTPIGNMQDVSLRAVEVLLTADVVACEDTRRAGILLQKIREMVSNHQSPTINNQPMKQPRLISYYDQVEQQKTPEIIAMLLSGLSVALISDAGTPLVSDPGYRVVKEAIAAGIRVESIPGPSAVIAALTVSGLPSDKFFFLGYLPKKEGHRKTLLESLKNLTGQLKTTVVFFEAPHRIKGTLIELSEIFGEDKHMVIARELTKIYEDVQRDTLQNLQKHFAKVAPKGEFVILFSTAEK